jgi:hypothetical protein
VGGGVAGDRSQEKERLLTVDWRGEEFGVRVWGQFGAVLWSDGDLEPNRAQLPAATGCREGSQIGFVQFAQRQVLPS